MQPAEVVQSGNPRRQPPQRAPEAPLVEHVLGSYVGEDVAAAHELHGEEGIGLVEKELVQRDQVGARHFRKAPKLPLEAVERLSSGVPEELHGKGRLRILSIARLIHVPVRPDAQKAQQLEALPEHRANTRIGEGSTLSLDPRRLLEAFLGGVSKRRRGLRALGRHAIVKSIR